MKLRKRKSKEDIEEETTTKRRKTEGEENEQGISQKAIRMRRYRANLKLKREDKYDELKKRDAERNRNNRKLASEQRKGDKRAMEKHRKKERERKRKQRAKKADEEKSMPKKKSSKQHCNKERKTTENSKKKANVLRVQNWRLRVKLTDKDALDNEPETVLKSPFRSRSTEYRAVKKAMSNMPTTPQRRSRVIEKLINSPQTRKELNNKGLIMTERARKQLNMGQAVMKSLKQNITDLKPKQGGTSVTQKTAYKNILQCVLDKSITKYHKFGNALSAYLKIRRPRGKDYKKREQWWKPKARKIRKDRIPESTREKVKSFYLSLEISRQVPNKKDVKSVEGEKIQQHIMTMTLSYAFEVFKKKYPNVKLGLTTFKKLKPANVKRVSETSHKSCLCQICCNLSLKIDGLNKYSQTGDGSLKEKMKGLNKTRIADMSLCDYQGTYANFNCLDRKCDTCSPRKVSEFLAISDTEDIIQWYSWEQIQVTIEDNTSKRVTSCVPKETSVGSFLKELENDLQKYPGHIFRAKWQQNQVQTCIDNLNDNAVIMLMDFSENYRCRFQNESQSAYFDQRQVTVHPFMCYYKGKIEVENSDEDFLVKHSIIAISNDTKHDAFAVKSFEKNVYEVLNTEINHINRIIKFSDGAACQYKGKNTFAHLSKDEYNITHNYFETSHGKSPCDGLGAVVKNTCYNAMISGKAVIGNATDVYEFCKQKLEHSAKLVGTDEDRCPIRRHIHFDHMHLNICI